MTTNSGQNIQVLTANANENGPDSERSSGRYCWICLASEEEDPEAAWVQPCKCRGTTKWVHQACLQRWFDEKHEFENISEVSCPQCKTEYIMVYPNASFLANLLDKVDRFFYNWHFYMTGGLLFAGVYWCAFSFGAVTVMQVFGLKEGLALIEKKHAITLITVLPAIPLVLILGRLVRWEDALLGFIIKNINKVPILRSFSLFGPNMTPYLNRQDFSPSSGRSASRTICGGLLLPTISSLFGKVFFKSVESNPRKIIFGGMTFIALKGFLKIYHNLHTHNRQNQEEIFELN